jgi:hypothetical protein
MFIWIVRLRSRRLRRPTKRADLDPKTNCRRAVASWDKLIENGRRPAAEGSRAALTLTKLFPAFDLP